MLSPYESMLWPLQALFRFVTGQDVISSIEGWAPRNSSSSGECAGITPRFLVVAGENDVLCTPSILRDAADRYRTAFQYCVRMKKLDGISEDDVLTAGGEDDGYDGVSFKVVKELGHHLQNHVEWQRGAEEILRWAQEL